MTLVTPSNLKYIISLSISSRVTVFIVQLLSSLIIRDHYADAYRNQYHIALTRGALDTTSISSPVKLIYRLIQGYTKWDSQYFLEIANDGYLTERHLAFLPLYPLIVSLFRQVLFGQNRINFDRLLPSTRYRLEDQALDSESIQDYICSAFIGVALNNFIFFPIACLSLFALTKLIKGNNEKYAKDVVWLFCFNPASIFFSACYTESLYAALAFTAFFMIEYKSTVYLSSHIEQNPNARARVGPLSHLNRLLYICSPCLPFMAFSTATRSNGLVNIGFIVYQLILKYVHLGKLKLSFLSKLVYLLEFVQDLLVLFMAAVISASGYISFQIYSYIKFCQQSPRKSGQLNLKPSWCYNLIPHPYSQVQAKFWDVGLFRYYQLKQLPNFLLALPITVMALVGSSRRARSVQSSRLMMIQFPYYVQIVTLVLLCGVTINVQVLTRLLASSCPALYWIAGDISGESRRKSRIISMYFMTYLIVGTILHTTFYPWT